MIAILYVRARFTLARATFALAQSRRHDQASAAALARAKRLMAAAGNMADRAGAARSVPARNEPPAADLLFGSRAIATHLGISKGTARHLIRSRAIPWFGLAGVACARRSTLAAHFAALEASTRS